MKKQILSLAIALPIVIASATSSFAVVSKPLILNDTLVESRLKSPKPRTPKPPGPGKGTNTPKTKPGPPPKQ